MYLKTAIKRLREGKPVSDKLILKWLEELEECREREKPKEIVNSRRLDIK